VLTDREALYKILDQGEKEFLRSEVLKYSREDEDYTVKYFELTILIHLL
jgi:hypothetical protein